MNNEIQLLKLALNNALNSNNFTKEEKNKIEKFKNYIIKGEELHSYFGCKIENYKNGFYRWRKMINGKNIQIYASTIDELKK